MKANGHTNVKVSILPLESLFYLFIWFFRNIKEHLRHFLRAFALDAHIKRNPPHLSAQTTCGETLKQLVLLGALGDKMYPMNERLRWRRRRAAGRHAPRMDTAGRNGRSGDSRTMLEIFWRRNGELTRPSLRSSCCRRTEQKTQPVCACLALCGGGRPCAFLSFLAQDVDDIGKPGKIIKSVLLHKGNHGTLGPPSLARRRFILFLFLFLNVIKKQRRLFERQNGSLCSRVPCFHVQSCNCSPP